MPKTWTKAAALKRYGLDARPMEPAELMQIRSLLGDGAHGPMPQDVFAALLGINERQLRNMEIGVRVRDGVARVVPIPPRVAMFARLLRKMRERGS